jgi:hypothetical protein
MVIDVFMIQCTNVSCLQGYVRYFVHLMAREDVLKIAVRLSEVWIQPGHWPTTSRLAAS